MEQNRVITISRQYGSGGRQIGALLAQRLGVPFYDKEIIALAAEQSGVPGACFHQPERDFSPALSWDLPPGGFYEQPLSSKVYLAQRAVIQDLAQQGPCVIVGRGAGELLRDAVPLLRVFIHADIAARTRRALVEYGDRPEKIQAHISNIDKKREAYLRFYTGVCAGQMENYHLCLDSGFAGVEGSAAILEAAYRAG